MVFFGGVYGSVFPGAALITAPWHVSDTMAWAALFLIAASGVAAMFCLTHAYRTGQPAQLAPFEYFMIVASLIYGTLIWHDVVTPQEFIGIILIILSGIYLTRQMQ
jgi:drug/metabolite transporter (DMT)-like permease